MELERGTVKVCQMRSVKVPLPGINYSSVEVSESITYIVTDEEYEDARAKSVKVLDENVCEGTAAIIARYQE